MKICHLATELSPIAKVGGLADVTLGLSRALQKKGHEVFLILPRYACLSTEDLHEVKLYPSDLKVTFSNKTYHCKVMQGKVCDLKVYFIDCEKPQSFFDREKIYGYRDDVTRFSFFTLAALHFLSLYHSNIDVLHIHEWHTALAAPMLQYLFKDRLKARLVLTLHNLGYQGQTSLSLLKKVGLGPHLDALLPNLQDLKKESKINLLKGALLYSDFITTVSPTYSKEIQKAPFGKGLEPVIEQQKGKLIGILNGIDQEIWNPKLDSALPINYTSHLLENKKTCKESLKKELDLATNETAPLVACICRLVPQKGLRMIRKAIHTTLKLKGQFILFGSSPISKIQEEFEQLKTSLASNSNIRFIFQSYNEPLAHRIYAGSDMLISPSIFEPCGLTQLIALRYGTVPIVRKTGGLADSVFDIENDLHILPKTNGFHFSPPTSKAMEQTLKRAFHIYCKQPMRWKEMIQRGMNMDFGWAESTDQYLSVYQADLKENLKLKKEN